MGLEGIAMILHVLHGTALSRSGAPGIVGYHRSFAVARDEWFMICFLFLHDLPGIVPSRSGSSLNTYKNDTHEYMATTPAFQPADNEAKCNTGLSVT